MKIFEEEKVGIKQTLFDQGDLSAQPGQFAKMSSVDSVKSVIIHLGEDFQGLAAFLEIVGCRRVS